MKEYDQKNKQQEETHEQNSIYFLEIGLRLFALVTSITASCLMFTNKQTALVFDVPMDAKYSYTSAFKFFAIATAIVSVFALLSFVLTFILRWKGTTLKANSHFLLFLHDLVMTLFLLAANAAATAIGYVGKYGNDHAGWTPICDIFHAFCHKTLVAIGLGYLSFLCFLALVLFSVSKSNKHHFTTVAQIQDI